MKTLTVKSINSIDTIYIFRDNDIEVEVRFEKNKVYSSLELTEQEKKDISKLLKYKYENIVWHWTTLRKPKNELKKWHKLNNPYKK